MPGDVTAGSNQNPTGMTADHNPKRRRRLATTPAGLPRWGPRSMPAYSRLILLAIVALVLLYGVIYPNAVVFTSALQSDGSWSLANFLQVLSQRGVIESAFTSIAVSVFTVLLCALVGLPLAFLFERYSFPGRAVFATLAALPLVLTAPRRHGCLHFPLRRIRNSGAVDPTHL